MHVAVPIVIIDGKNGFVDWYEVAVGAIIAMVCCVVIRHETALEKRVRNERDASYNI